MSRTIALEIHDTAGNTIAQYHLESAGGAQHIDAVSGAYYQFTDLTTGLGPEGLSTARAGEGHRPVIWRVRSTRVGTM